MEDTLQEVPKEGQQEEEDAVDNAPSVGAAAIMATEALEVLEGVVATPQRAQRHLGFADPSASSAATRTIHDSIRSCATLTFSCHPDIPQ